jgi:hypothetical protein
MRKGLKVQEAISLPRQQVCSERVGKLVLCWPVALSETNWALRSSCERPYLGRYQDGRSLTEDAFTKHFMQNINRGGRVRRSY